ncbi:hypothetical protein RJT34_06118 [Clitoria ternatea]|uniref:Phosphatidylinositol N-acetylglucosaminyltransferase subunit H conserved domain-containing protein n=1 Tax=Clitoria ternatea TaxID=43366 RepID=A0AAN9K4I4_CLITE
MTIVIVIFQKKTFENVSKVVQGTKHIFLCNECIASSKSEADHKVFVRFEVICWKNNPQCSIAFHQFRMVKFSISNARYTYVHDDKYPSEGVDIHHIVLKSSSAKYLFVYGSALLILAGALYLSVLKEKSISLVYYSLLFDIFLVKLLLPKPVKKESVVIMPAFGVQLETHYVSGKVNRCFVPVDKILKPVLLECVTPVTCYWTLSLIIREESELVLVFKNLRPPVKMLVHVWKALCAATGSEEEICTLPQ